MRRFLKWLAAGTHRRQGVLTAERTPTRPPAPARLIPLTPRRRDLTVMANDPRFEVYPMMQRRIGGRIEHPIKGRIDVPASFEPTGEYGWRFRAANGQITAVGGEGFTTKRDAERAIEDFCRALLGTDGLGGIEFADGGACAVIIDVDE